jgi:hypothetical protein
MDKSKTKTWYINNNILSYQLDGSPLWAHFQYVQPGDIVFSHTTHALSAQQAKVNERNRIVLNFHEQESAGLCSCVVLDEQETETRQWYDILQNDNGGPNTNAYFKRLGIAPKGFFA